MRRLLLLLCCLSSTACLSGLGPGEPTPIRFFSAAPSPATGGDRLDGLPTLRLRRVSAAAHLRERMVWRASDVEFGFYETRRWTEQPTVWVEQGLAGALEQEGVALTERAAGLALDVELVGFEEQLAPHLARVALDLSLTRAGAEVLLQRRVELMVAITRDDPEVVARAMASALAEALEEAAQAVAGTMSGVTAGD
jgi:ABC-type uncharacterized transport system auxiliary subunit